MYFKNGYTKERGCLTNAERIVRGKTQEFKQGEHENVPVSVHTT